MNIRAQKELLVAVLLLPLAGCAYKYKMPDGSWVSSRVLCGDKPCRPGTATGVLFQFRDDPYVPNVTPTTTPLQAASQIIGWTVKNDDLSGGMVYTCSATGTNPFAVSDISALGSAAGREADYTKTDTLKIDIKAAVATDLKAIQALGPLPASVNIGALEAKLTATYGKMNGSVLTIKSRYHVFGLAQPAMTRVFEQRMPADCVTKIQSGFSLITAVGLLWFDVEYASAGVSEVLATTQNELTANGISYSLGGSIRRKVSETLKSTTKDGFQVLAWRYAGAERIQ